MVDLKHGMLGFLRVDLSNALTQLSCARQYFHYAEIHVAPSGVFAGVTSAPVQARLVLWSCLEVKL